jgi:hypothetical protein
MKHSMGFALLTLLSVSCGTEEKDFAGSLGACTQVIAEGMNICTEYSYTAKAEEDPKSEAEASVKESCSDEGMTWSAAKCATTGSVGSCVISSKVEDASVSATMYFTGANMTVETAQTACEAASATFTKS